MAELKTKPTDQSVEEFLDAIPDESRRAECRALADLMRRVTGAEPKLWGQSMVGFGSFDPAVLEELVRASVAHMRATYETR